MTTEELKVKVSLDTSGLKQDINKAKKSLDDLNSQTNKAMSGASSKTGVTSESLTELKSTMEAVANFQFANLFIDNFDKAKDAVVKFKKDVTGIMTGTFKQIAASTKFGVVNWGDSLGNVYNGIQAAIPWQTKYKRENDIGQGLGDSFAHLKEAGSDLKIMLGNIGIAAKAAASGLLAVGATVGAILAVVAAVTGLAGAVAALARARDNAQAAWSAERIGMTANEYGEWGYVIQQTGGEIDELTDYIKTLSDVQNQVREGTEDMIAIYQRLGMTVEEVSGMSQGEMFARTLEGLQNVKDEVERTSLAYKIFGEDDAAKVTTLLNLNNTEIERLIENYYLLGGAMSGELVTNSKRLTGSLNNLSTAWVGLKNTLAEVFLPIIIPVVQWLTRAVAVVNMFIRAIFGKEIVSASSDITNVASAYTGYTDSADKATNATNKVTEAVERLKRVTMGFDELNKLPGIDTTGSVSSGADGDTGSSGVSQLPSGGGIGGLDLPTTEDLGLDGISEWIDENKQKIQDIAALLLTFGGIALAVFCILHGNIVGAVAGLALANVGINIGSGDDGIWTRLVEGIKGICETFMSWYESFIIWLGEGIAKAWEKFTGFLQGIGEFVAGLVDGIRKGLGSFFGWFIGLFVDEAYAADSTSQSKEAGKNFMDSFSEGMAEAWENFKESPVGRFFSGVHDKAVTLTAEFREKGSDIRKAVVKAHEAVKTVTKTLTAKFKETGSTVRKNVVNAYNKIVTKTRTLTAKFKESGSRKTIAKYWDKFKSKTSTLSVAFKDSFTSAIKKAWNGLVKAINGAIGTINKIPGVNISKLPYLATGGIVTGPTTAVIGERGAEAVLPLTGSQSMAWMDKLADKIAAKNGGSGGPTKVILTVDGKQLGWATIDNINSITKQTGVLPLSLV